MIQYWETHTLQVISGEKKGIVPSLLLMLLAAISGFYRICALLRNKMYDFGILSSYRPPVPTISIGNIVAGGTGKTPLAIVLAKALEKKGKVAILSRGYRRRGSTPHMVSGSSAAVECGDEPLLLFKKVPQAEVWVGSNRSLSAKIAVQRGAKIIILDDGLQHRRINRDFEIIAVDGEDPFGGGFFLPRGMLRESPRALARATLVVVNSSVVSEEVRNAVARYTKAPIVFASPRLELPEGVTTVGLFSGIAKPHKFKKLVEGSGVKVVKELIAPDHTLPPKKALAAFAEECKSLGATHLFCTEKDGIKMFPAHLALPIISLPMNLEFTCGESHWTQLLERIHTQ